MDCSFILGISEGHGYLVIGGVINIWNVGACSWVVGGGRGVCWGLSRLEVAVSRCHFLWV